MKILSILFVTLLAMTAFAQRQNAIFSIQDMDIKYNHYFVVANIFDSAMVYYEIGNISYINNMQEKTRIYLSDSITKIAGKYLQASNIQGENPEFHSILRTESFFLPEQATQLEFYRRSLINKDPCSSVKPNNGANKWGYDDMSKFRIDIVDAGTYTVLASIDSVISNPVANRIDGVLIGSEPYTTIHLRDLPSNCKNKNVYLRVTTFRVGQSPFGMVAKSMNTWVNRSALYDYNGLYVDNENFFDSLNTIFRSKLIQNLDSIQSTSGNVSIPEFYPPNFGNLFMDRYLFKGRYNVYIEANGDTIKIARNELLKESIESEESSDKLKFITVAPSILNGQNEVYLKFYNSMQQSLNIFVTDLNGAKIANICNNNFEQGIHTINFITKNLLNGLYFINIVDNNAEQWVTQKIYIIN
ncbi:MAG TPA: hypothetical protein PLE30_02755 [Candidatus Kapabacteria bacterium]|nr:hypothetical protein [Candidatus Kapabacteria bacterium]